MILQRTEMLLQLCLESLLQLFCNIHCNMYVWYPLHTILICYPWYTISMTGSCLCFYVLCTLFMSFNCRYSFVLSRLVLLPVPQVLVAVPGALAGRRQRRVDGRLAAVGRCDNDAPPQPPQPHLPVAEHRLAACGISTQTTRQASKCQLSNTQKSEHTHII